MDIEAIAVTNRAPTVEELIWMQHAMHDYGMLASLLETRTSLEATEVLALDATEAMRLVQRVVAAMHEAFTLMRMEMDSYSTQDGK